MYSQQQPGALPTRKPQRVGDAPDAAAIVVDIEQQSGWCYCIKTDSLGGVHAYRSTLGGVNVYRSTDWVV